MVFGAVTVTVYVVVGVLLRPVALRMVRRSFARDSRRAIESARSQFADGQPETLGEADIQRILRDAQPIDPVETRGLIRRINTVIRVIAFVTGLVTAWIVA